MMFTRNYTELATRENPSTNDWTNIVYLYEDNEVLPS